VQNAEVNDQFTEVQKNEILNKIGQIHVKLQELHILKTHEIQNGLTALSQNQIHAKKAEIRQKVDELPTLLELDALQLDRDVNPGNFFEALVLCIKNNANTEQTRFGKLRNLRKNQKLDEIKT
jgi:hypothetical protein